MKRLISSVLAFAIMSTSFFGVQCFAEKQEIVQDVSKVLSEGINEKEDNLDANTLSKVIEDTEKLVKENKEIKKSDKEKCLVELENAKKEINSNKQSTSKFYSFAKSFIKYSSIVVVSLAIGYFLGQSREVSTDLRDNNFRLFCARVIDYFPFLKGAQNHMRAEVAKSGFLQGVSDQIEVWALEFSNLTNGRVPASYISLPGRFLVCASTLIKPVIDSLSFIKLFI